MPQGGKRELAKDETFLAVSKDNDVAVG